MHNPTGIKVTTGKAQSKSRQATKSGDYNVQQRREYNTVHNTIGTTYNHNQQRGTIQFNKGYKEGNHNTTTYVGTIR